MPDTWTGASTIWKFPDGNEKFKLKIVARHWGNLYFFLFGEKKIKNEFPVPRPGQRDTIFNMFDGSRHKSHGIGRLFDGPIASALFRSFLVLLETHESTRPLARICAGKIATQKHIVSRVSIDELSARFKRSPHNRSVFRH